MTLSSRGGWLELQLCPGMPCLMPMWAATLSEGSPCFFQGGGGPTQAEIFWALLICSSWEPGSICCQPLPRDSCMQHGSAFRVPNEGSSAAFDCRSFIFTQPYCQWGHVTSVELIKRHPKHWCQLLLVISAPGSFPLWHIKRSRRI